jgi:hypothetical protein
MSLLWLAFYGTHHWHAKPEGHWRESAHLTTHPDIHHQKRCQKIKLLFVRHSLWRKAGRERAGKGRGGLLWP